MCSPTSQGAVLLLHIASSGEEVQVEQILATGTQGVSLISAELGSEAQSLPLR